MFDCVDELVEWISGTDNDCDNADGDKKDYENSDRDAIRMTTSRTLTRTVIATVNPSHRTTIKTLDMMF